MQKVTTRPEILICGATGQQGGAIATQLLLMGKSFRAMSRTLNKLNHLKEMGIDTVAGSLSSKEALMAALDGMKQAFLVTTPYEAGTDKEVEQGMNFIDAAQKSGIEHIVFSSVSGCDQKSGIPHFESKWLLEERLKSSGIPFTILRPVFFMENFGSPWFLPSIQAGKLALPMSGDVPLQMVSLDVIGGFGAAAFKNPSDFTGKTLDLASDSITLLEAMDLLSKKTGKEITFERLSDEKGKEVLGDDFLKMFSWFDKVGYSVDLKEVAQWGIPLTTFGAHLEQASWVTRV